MAQRGIAIKAVCSDGEWLGWSEMVQIINCIYFGWSDKTEKTDNH